MIDITNSKHDFFYFEDEEREVRSTLSKENNLILNLLTNSTSSDGNFQYTTRQVETYVDLMQEGVDVRPILNPGLSYVEIQMLGDLIEQGVNVTGYAELLEKMDWLNVERELLNRERVPKQVSSLQERILKTYRSAYLDRNGKVRIQNPAEHKACLLAEGLSKDEAEQVVKSAKRFGAYKRRF